MIDVDEARKRWQAEFESYENFGALVRERVRVAMKAAGIWAVVTHRPKETHSLIKKLIKKPKYTYDTLPDKVGVRCMVRYISDVKQVVEIIQSLFDCSSLDNKQQQLAEKDQVGYISIHIEVKLKSDDPEASKFSPLIYWAELQVRTQAQHLWAEMSHDTFYKDEEELMQSPEGLALKRRISLMAGLIEVADQEFDRLNNETMNWVTTVYRDLERHFYKLSTRRPDKELSLEVIQFLLPLYHANPNQIADKIDDFVTAHTGELASMYENEENAEETAFFYQPEVFMILERLQDDEYNLRREWNKHFPERELERVANTFGMSLD